MTDEDKLLVAIGSLASNIGADYKARNEAFEAAAKTRAERAGVAATEKRNDERAVAGFDSFAFQGLSAVAGAFGKTFNDPTAPNARVGAELAARSFMASFTGAGDKTLAGGTLAGYVAHIMLGSNGDRLRRAVQARLDYWQESVDSFNGKPADKATLVKEANRYLVVCGNAPLEDGSIPTDKDGKPMAMRHMGRKACVVNGVNIPHGRGTDRKAQMAALSRLYTAHGDAVLDPQVLDAFLDNGGKFTMEKTAKDHASDARDAINRVLEAGGNLSADCAALTIMVAKLSAIVTNGLAESGVAATPAVPPATPAADADEAAGKDSDGNNESETEAATAPRKRRAASGGL